MEGTRLLRVLLFGSKRRGRNNAAMDRQCGLVIDAQVIEFSARVGQATHLGAPGGE